MTMDIYSVLQAGYWGRAAMDPEPGRCRRTDGKKWRCSRDVVAGQKYCERHMHRGRNRSRKPVETTTTNPSTTAAAVGGGGGGCSLSSNSNRVIGGGGGRPFLTVESGNYFSTCGQTPSVDLLHLNQGSDFVWVPLQNFVCLSLFDSLVVHSLFPQPSAFCLIMLSFQLNVPFFSNFIYSFIIFWVC